MDASLSLNGTRTDRFRKNGWGRNFVLDTKIAFKWKNWEPYIEIDNLLDRYYEPHDGYPASGITYTFGILREF